MAERGPFLSLAPVVPTPWVHLEPDTRIDRFVMRRPLGKGSFSTVYLAHDTVRSEDVAVKMVAIGPHHAEAAALQLRHELAAYDKITDFTHVLRVHDLFTVPWGGAELLMLAMEYADGGTWRKWLLGHRNDWQTRRSQGRLYFKQICLGLRAIHDVGEAHRDVKPENLLLVDGVLKVADFGASSCVQHLSVATTGIADDDCCDRGTPTYMSPEQFNAAHPDDADNRTDIYALGVIYFELLHPKGRPPFGGTYARLRQLHMKGSVPFLPQADELDVRMIRRCLEKDPDERYQCVEELLDELEGRTTSPTPEPPQQAEIARELDGTWQEARRHAEQGRFGAALRLVRRVTEAQPEHGEAQDLLDELQQRYDQAHRLYAALEESPNDRGLDEQLTLLSEAVESFPDHPDGRVVQARLEIRARQYRQAMEDALHAAQREDWESAKSSLVRAGELNPGAAEVERPTRFVADILRRIEDARQQIDSAIAAERWSQALAVARGIDAYSNEMANGIPSWESGDRR